jgi:hypothetical protein
MDDANQIVVPPSFTALYATASGYRLTEPMALVRERYELCEDLAQMLTDQASTAQFTSGGSERQVLATMRQGLAGAESPVSAREAQWIAMRLAELLGWEPPAAPEDGES